MVCNYIGGIKNNLENCINKNKELGSSQIKGTYEQFMK